MTCPYNEAGLHSTTSPKGQREVGGEGGERERREREREEREKRRERGEERRGEERERF